MRVPLLVLFVFFFPGVFLHLGVTGACPVTTDLIMRVNVRTTTSTTLNKSRIACFTANIRLPFFYCPVSHY